MTSNDQLAAVEVLCEFFEIAIHNILYARKLYPDAVFESRKKYGVVVYQAVHPGIQNYIQNCLKAVAFHCKKRQLQRLYVCFESDEIVRERFVFDVLGVTELYDSDPFFVELEQYFRSFILKLHSSQIYLPDLPTDSSFSIRLQTSFNLSVEFNENPSFEEFPWVEESKSDIISEDRLSIIPVYTVDTQCLKIQILIETPQLP
ncbi:mitotic spindle assembly checkpoint protein MAD2B [Sitophilus oryzae]|uniref:Mitotic spindle assembly checkpoint protein MAD2B n=1 Tax=Sitophilus oryzae TaxID=7048 RepID=A0A6J2X5J5_SITOR|nr:mitotic spindle assembly checkpoint protein MAD2B [Sitophilus oryzae]